MDFSKSFTYKPPAGIGGIRGLMSTRAPGIAKRGKQIKKSQVEYARRLQDQFYQGV